MQPRTSRRDGTAPPLADALTVNPYLGADSLEPFADACRASGGLAFVLVRTSNPGGADIQELELADGSRVWEHVARIVASLAPVAGAVVGATQPGAVARARELMPRGDLPAARHRARRAATSPRSARRSRRGRRAAS